MFDLYFTDEAQSAFASLKNNASDKKRYNAVKKAIALLSADPRHISLQTHEYTSLKVPGGEKIFEAYAQQKTPAAYRIFWYYGPSEGKITICTITPHS